MQKHNSTSHDFAQKKLDAAARLSPMVKQVQTLTSPQSPSRYRLGMYSLNQQLLEPTRSRANKDSIIRRALSTEKKPRRVIDQYINDFVKNTRNDVVSGKYSV